MDQQKKRVVDLLLVVDETDYAKMYMHQIISAISSVSHAPSIGRASLLDTEGAKQKILCHKTVFLVDGETQALQYAVKPWVDNLRDVKDNSPKFLILLHGELGEDTFGIPKANIVCVDALKYFERWWPKIIRFVFKLYKTDLSVYCEIKEIELLNTPDIMPHTCIYNRSKECLVRCNANINDNEEGARTVLTCASRGVNKQTLALSNTRVSNRVIAPEDSELHVELNASYTTTYTPVETLKCILLILLDLGMFSRKRECIICCKRGFRGLQYCAKLFIYVLIKTLAIIIAALNLPAYIVYAIPAFICLYKNNYKGDFINTVIVMNMIFSFWPVFGYHAFVWKDLEIFEYIIIGTLGFAYFFCWISVSSLIVRLIWDIELGIFTVPIKMWKYTDDTILF